MAVHGNFQTKKRKHERPVKKKRKTKNKIKKG